MKHIEVVAAIIKKNNRILCTQRGDDGRFLALKWEFPGGKIEAGESHQEALKREIFEELKLNIAVNDYLMTVEHQYPFFHLTMHAYYCTTMDDSIVLEEHHQYQWLLPSELTSLDWAEADLPIVNRLK